MIYLRFATLEFTPDGAVTHFGDGTSWGALPHDEPHYHYLAFRYGHGGDIIAYCRAHELCHHLIAEVFGCHSPVLWALAHGEKTDSADRGGRRGVGADIPPLRHHGRAAADRRNRLGRAGRALHHPDRRSLMMNLFGYEIGIKLIAYIVGGLLLIGVTVFGVRYCDNRHSEAAQGRVNAAQGQAQSNSAADAVSTVAASGASEAASEDLTRSNEQQIRAAEGANAKVNPAVRDAGIAALCRRQAYKDDPRCKR